MKRQFYAALLGIGIFSSMGNYCSARLSGGPLIDSLKGALVGMKEDTTQVNTLFRLSSAFYGRNTDSGIYYGNEGLILAKRLGWKKGIGNMLNALATNNAIAREYTIALKYYNEALQNYSEADFQKGVTSVLQNIGVTYKNLHDNVKAMDHYHRALEVANRSGDKATAAIIHGNIGGLYVYLGDLPKAIQYYHASLVVKEQIGDDVGVITTKVNLAGLYERIGQKDKVEKQYEEALALAEKTGDKLVEATVLLLLGKENLEQHDFTTATRQIKASLAIAKESNNKKSIADAYGGMGVLLRYQKIYNYSLAYFQQAIAIHMSIGNKEAQASDLMLMGDTYMDIAGKGPVMPMVEIATPQELNAVRLPATALASMKLAIDCYEQAVAINKENGHTSNLPNIYKKLADAYERTGQYARSAEALRNHIAITDTIFSQENAQKIAGSQLGYEFDKRRLADSLQNVAKVREVRLQYQRQQAYTFAGIGGVLGLLGFSIFVVRNNKLLSREKKRSDDLLLNILPEDVATELKNTGHTTARHFDNVTILFTDFVNFTQNAEKMKPQALIDELHTCFTAFDEIMHRHGIEKIKTVGDAYLAVAGAPRADANHAAAVLQAGMEIAAYMEDRYAKLGERSFRVRVGAHSGSVVAGTVGVKKFAYDVWGDSVNIAARMEQNSLPGRVNVSRSTYELTKDKFRFEYRGEIDAKNKGKLGMYFVSVG